MPSGDRINIKGFIETSFIDWKDGLSSVLFTGGCNFRCPFCHNRQLVKDPESLDSYPFDVVILRLKMQIKWVERVVVTGGEPTIHRALPETLKVLKGIGMNVKLDTNGSNPDMVRSLVREHLIDYVAMDVKGPMDRYSRWCGTHVDTAKVEETVSFLLEGNVPYEFRMTVVPSFHREEDVYEVAEYLKGADAFNVQGFRPSLTLDQSFMNIKPFTPDTIDRIRKNAGSIVSSSQKTA